MTEAIVARLIEQLNSSVFVLLVMLGAAFWGIYRLGLLVAKFTMQDGKIDKLEDLAKEVTVLTTKVDLIYQHTLPATMRPTAAHSPISLTDVGRAIATSIKAAELLTKYRSDLCAAVDASSPKNAYDIQMAAMKVSREKLITFLNDVEVAQVKQEAFSRGLLAEDVLSVVGVLLRDDILKEKKLPVSDVDKHEKKPA